MKGTGHVRLSIQLELWIGQASGYCGAQQEEEGHMAQKEVLSVRLQAMKQHLSQERKEVWKGLQEH
jgi:hypothetical protein